MTSIQREDATLYEQIESLKNVVRETQDILLTYAIVTSGISSTQTITRLINLLDSPDVTQLLNQ